MSAGARQRVVVVTQHEGAGARLSSRLEAAGVRVWSVPVVAHEPAADLGPVDEALERLDAYAWAAFTSVRAVEAVCDRPAWRRRAWREDARPFVGAVGPMTARALAGKGAPVRLCPGEPGAAALTRSIIDSEGGSVAGLTVFWPRADIAHPDLREILIGAGALVVDPVVYRTVPACPADLPACVRAIAQGEVDAVAFLSPSSAANFAAAIAEGDATLAALAGRTIIASVGPTTTAALVAAGAPPAVEASARTGEGLASALLSYFGLNEGVT